MNFNQLIMGALAVVAIVIVALALSGTNHSIAVFIQGGLIIAIIAVLVRDSGNAKLFFNAWNNLTQMAVGTSGK